MTAAEDTGRVDWLAIELPRPTRRKDATEDENGADYWEYRDGEVIVYGDGAVEWRPLGFYDTADPGIDRLREAAAALLAAANVAERLKERG